MEVVFFHCQIIGNHLDLSLSNELEHNISDLPLDILYIGADNFSGEELFRYMKDAVAKVNYYVLFLDIKAKHNPGKVISFVNFLIRLKKEHHIFVKGSQEELDKMLGAFNNVKLIHDPGEIPGHIYLKANKN